MATDADSYPDYRLLLRDTSGKPLAELMLSIIEQLAVGSPDPYSPEFARLPLAQRWMAVGAYQVLPLILDHLRPFGTPPSTPAKASALIGRALGFTPDVIAAIRHHERVRLIGLALHDDVPIFDEQVDQIADRLARAFQVSKTKVYRLAQEADRDRERLSRETDERREAVMRYRTDLKKTD
jgi:hypothetical protein